MSAEIYKALILGPPNVGKTSLIRRYLEDAFSESYTATVGVGMNVASFEFPDGKIVLSVVDIGGQQSFTALRGRFYLGSHHVIFVYDRTSRETFDNIPKWYESLNRGPFMTDDEALCGSLVANKSDKADEIQVSTQDGKHLANLLSLEYFETSAKTGEGVSELFIQAATTSRMKVRSRIA
ncbi:MAG: Rab family GTPase [Candidatus Thorarchaeota archaeon]